MKERCVNFTTYEVRAALDSRLKQFRRPLSHQPHAKCDTATLGLDGIWRFSRPTARGINKSLSDDDLRCPYGQVGDRLYVREAWRLFEASVECDHADFPCSCPEDGTPFYKATHATGDGEKWTRSIHMPRSLSRILLEITEIKVERLKSISRQDAAQQGLIQLPATGRYVVHQGGQYFGMASGNPCEVFEWLWEETYGEKSWKANPWVWVVKFKIVSTNEQGIDS
ncbi:hypothetical protein [Acinetobacter colistiniresistens]|uniref:hypothetical protein n=1 Tax=Acinetobacter colistiniresistens TaxID=280145 RepID=UPI0012507CF8|nr:hypothetical protein [Acinetobacter colistiniresistens]